MGVPYRTYKIEKSRKSIIEENASKYLFFAWTLNRLKEFLLCHDAIRVNEGYITKSIYKTTLLKGLKESDNLIEKWLLDMELIGLIKIEHDPAIEQTLIYLTKKGLDEYKNQTYHVLAANLLEAQESRRLFKTAIIIAIVSILISIGTGLMA